MNGDDPAFPLTLTESGGKSITDYDQYGLSKREWFAAHAPPYPFAMPGMMVGRDTMESLAATLVEWNRAWADALIAELSKKTD